MDRYGAGLLFLLVLTIGLNVTDAFLTMIILDSQGWELNPIVRSAIEVYGHGFWVWKFLVVSVSLIFLCLHSKFRRVRGIIVAACSIYVAIVAYEIFLIVYRLPGNP